MYANLEPDREMSAADLQAAGGHPNRIIRGDGLMDVKEFAELTLDWMEKTHQRHMDALDRSQDFSEELGKSLRDERIRSGKLEAIVWGQRLIIWLLILFVLALIAKLAGK